VKGLLGERRDPDGRAPASGIFEKGRVGSQSDDMHSLRQESSSYRKYKQKRRVAVAAQTVANV